MFAWAPIPEQFSEARLAAVLQAADRGGRRRRRARRRLRRVRRGLCPHRPGRERAAHPPGRPQREEVPRANADEILRTRATTALAAQMSADDGKTWRDRRRGPRHGRRAACSSLPRPSGRTSRPAGGRGRRSTGVSARSRSRPRPFDISGLRLVRRSGGAGHVRRHRPLRRADRRRRTARRKAAVEAALEAGKPVVTANKALLAQHGVELAALAEDNGRRAGFEAAVAGGIPVVKMLREALVGNAIARVYGILNGTCNYILTRMEAEGLSFADCLAEAQRLGYAEADPTFDVGGFDTAHKLAILASARLRLARSTPTRSTSRASTSITPADIKVGRRPRLPDQAARRRRAHAKAASSSASIRRWCRSPRRSRRSTASSTRSRSRPTRVHELLLVGPGAGGDADRLRGASPTSPTSPRGMRVRAASAARATSSTPCRQAPMQAHEGGYYIRLSVPGPARRRRGHRHAHGRARHLARKRSCSGRERARARRRRSARSPARVPVVLITYATTEADDPRRARRDRGRRLHRRRRRSSSASSANRRPQENRNGPGDVGHHPGQADRRHRPHPDARAGARHRARRHRRRRCCAGAGDEKAADQAAVDAMRRELNKLPIDGRVVIGEGERDEAPMLFIGEKVGTGDGPEGRHRRRSARRHDALRQGHAGLDRRAWRWPSAGTLLNAPDVYMDKIAIGPGYPEGVVDLDATREDNIQALAKAKGVKPRRDHRLRPRPAAPSPSSSTASARSARSIRLITDGDVAGVIYTANPTRPASTSISAPAARRKACWPRRRCAASAARCRAG